MQEISDNKLSLALLGLVLVLACCTDEAHSQSNGDIRLAGFGSNPQRGKLEIYYDGQWGSVCTGNSSLVIASSFERNAANVVCRQLGFGFAIAFYTGRYLPEQRSRYGVSSGALLLDEVMCSTDHWEPHLLRCSHGNLGQATCSHDTDVVVECSDVLIPYNGQVRLSGQSRGTLELYSDHSWNRVCLESGFSQSNADSACRQLGYTRATEFSGSSSDGGHWDTGLLSPSPERPCFTAALSHLPTATTAAPCSSVHITCEFRAEETEARTSGSDDLCTLNPVTPVNRDVRFQAPVVEAHKGTVEVYVDGEWGSFCDDQQFNFGYGEADVVCKQLGYPGALYVGGKPVLPGAIFDLSCSGVESRVGECKSEPVAVCSTSVEVECAYAGYPYGELLLREGAGATGNLLIYNGEVFQYVCHNNFEMSEARVACRQLGYRDAVAVRTNITLGAHDDVDSGAMFSLTNKCYGNETHLLECDQSDSSDEPCDSTVTIQCSTSTTGHALRLVAGGETSGQTSGRLEVNFGGSWSSVSASGFGQLSAHVACQELGFATANSVITDSRYGPGSGPVVFSDIVCTGYENSFLDCLYVIEDNSNQLSVAIECSEEETVTPGSLRLAAGNESSGSLEIREHGVWKRVCGQGFTEEMGVASCETLGFTGLNSFCTDSCLRGNDGYLFSLGPSCDGDGGLLQCGVPQTQGCTNSTTVGLVCTRPPVTRSTPSHLDTTNGPTQSIIPGLDNLYFYIIVGCVGLLLAMAALLLAVCCCCCCLSRRRKQQSSELWRASDRETGAASGARRHGNMYSNTNQSWPHIETNSKLKMERVGDFDDPNVSVRINGFTQTPSSATDSSTSLELKDRMVLDFAHEQIGSHVYENLPQRANNMIYVEGSSSPASPPPGYEELDFLPNNAKI